MEARQPKARRLVSRFAHAQPTILASAERVWAALWKRPGAAGAEQACQTYVKSASCGAVRRPAAKDARRLGAGGPEGHVKVMSNDVKKMF